MDDFYKEYILDHYRNPRNFGHLEDADAAAEDLNPLCGDRIRFELKLDGAMGKDISGSVHSSSSGGSGPKAEAVFHVTVK